MPRTDWGWLITPEELASWILHEDEELLVINKPGLVICHPSKHGPWSSLIGACREYFGAERLHMPSRLDRETSGVVVMARNAKLASHLQRAMERRRVMKIYHAILYGETEHAVIVDKPIGKMAGSAVILRRGVVEEGPPAITEFEPVAHGGGYTLVKVLPRTGRLHQIRVHANFIGHPVVGDKIYGPDEQHFIEFLQTGWTPKLAATLILRRQALHASEWVYGPYHFTAPMPSDFQTLLDAVGYTL
ncbi:MAG: RluA family pseudouridine synthase [Acidobacteria bacterium]|nr:RluA family pseudouridine synthase [Acidobacteriota bacterium]